MCYSTHIGFFAYIGKKAQMGKTTRFHPVSLHVIRGAAAYGGFGLGTLRQVQLSTDGRHAWYRAEIVNWPKGLKPERSSFTTLLGAIRGCFANDIEITSLSRRPNGRYYIDIDVMLDRPFETEGSLFPALVQE
jgi:hypothetical protein